MPSGAMASAYDREGFSVGLLRTIRVQPESILALLLAYTP